MAPFLRLLTAILVLASIAGCSGPDDAPELDPVFVVMCDDIDPGEPPHPCCTGFAFGTQVVTANHCVPDDQARLVSNRQWLHTASDSQIGSVVARDSARDIAWLTAVLDGPGLEQGGPVALGDSVTVLARFGAKPGTAYQQIIDRWRTSADTDYGDSGAAIVDATGAAVGVLTQCLTADGKQCDMSTGIFVELP